MPSPKFEDVPTSGVGSPSNIGEGEGRGERAAARRYDPEPLELPPLFRSPPQPIGMARWFATRFMWPQSVAWMAIAVVVFHGATPPTSRFASLGIDDVALLWFRNVVLMTIVIGGQHWWLHVRRAQGTEFKYDRRWLATERRTFTFDHQTRDNMFWTLVSGGAIAAVYEAAMLSLYARGSIPQLSSLGAIVFMTIVVFWIEGVHFYTNHRLLHWGPLYRRVHSLHHRNVNTGPWSGISMHPVEHLLYFSLPAVFLVVPGSPFIVTFCVVYLMLSPSPSHSGFHRLRISATSTLPAGDYFHNLHHRYFEVNYGMLLVPLDKWFGTFHDGSVEAHERMRHRRRRIAASTPKFEG